jgi:hypothetical protein
MELVLAEGRVSVPGQDMGFVVEEVAPGKFPMRCGFPLLVIPFCHLSGLAA